MVTSLENLQKYAKGTEVVLPDFAPGQPFVARLRRVSLTILLKEGKIPNKLFSAVLSVFGLDKNKDVEKTITAESLKENTEVMDIVAKDALVEPTYAQLEEIGLKLTQEQFVAIFDFAQSGVGELESFRTEQSDNVSAAHGEGVQEAAE